MNMGINVHRGGRRKCAVEGCGKNVNGNGLCGSHYNREKRHGDPLAGRTPTGQLIRFLEEVVGRPATDACILWPYVKNHRGYGIVKIKGRVTPASRATLMLVTSEKAGSGLLALHSCHTPSCINPRHLRWGTLVENMADKVADGTAPKGERNPAARLTEAQVRAIRKDGRALQAIATAYGISKSSAHNIKRRRTWAHLA